VVLSTSVLARPKPSRTIDLSKFQGRMMLQFSFDSSYKVDTPVSLPRLQDDTIENREERKKVEGVGSQQIITQGPYLHCLVSHGNWKGYVQSREKFSKKGHLFKYTMVRFHQFHEVGEYCDNSHSLLQRLLDNSLWQVRGYHNDVGKEDKISLNFGQPCNDKTKAIQKLSLAINSQRLIITDI
jgi:hypothetical protein